MGLLGYLLTKQNACPTVKAFHRMNLNQNKCLNSNRASNITAKVAKPIKKWPQKGRLRMIEFHFFGMPIKTLGSLGKIRVGRVTGNTHFFFFGLMLTFCTVCAFRYFHEFDLVGVCSYRTFDWLCCVCWTVMADWTLICITALFWDIRLGSVSTVISSSTCQGRSCGRTQTIMST